MMNKNLLQFFFLVLYFTISLPTANAQFVNFEDTWREFLSDEKTSNISKLTKPSKEQHIDYVKYCLMYANNYFCSGVINSSQELLDEIKTVGETKYKTIPGFKEKYEDLSNKVVAYHNVEKLWQRFLKSRDVSLKDLEVDDATKVCEKGTLAKYFLMLSHAHYCNKDLQKARDNFENRVLKLADHTSLKLSDVQGLEKEVEMTRALFSGLRKLGPVWKEFVKTGKSNGFEVDLPVIECFTIPSIKKYVLQGAADICNSGDDYLKKIDKLQASNPQELPADLKERLDWLKKEVGKYTGDLTALNKAWKEFVPKDTVSSGAKFGFEYCHKDAQIKAYIMHGTMNACTEGQQMLDSIYTVRKQFDPKLTDVIITKIKNLEKRLKAYDADLENLNKVWSKFIESKDTLLEPFTLAEFYCDKIAQIKSWTISGNFDTCEDGQTYIDKIDALEKSASLEYDDELACRVNRLRGKIWDCRYWELVLQARKETHEERERFGPASSLIMQGDLNSDQLPCETTVQYFPLKNIGIKYIITTFLCQEIDLAKMGDPEYYKKIATWVDGEVLKKYCEENMRCKEDFFIYLEGHTDGHPFNGARYKKSLEIPEGTIYTHYLNGEVLPKQTSREITNSLKSNTELGIARAWTVKQQLDFMQVPITIGAFEHPKTEKGGEFRRIEIELNITNLLLDFYEKRLTELLLASGIGERPEMC